MPGVLVNWSAWSFFAWLQFARSSLGPMTEERQPTEMRFEPAPLACQRETGSVSWPAIGFEALVKVLYRPALSEMIDGPRATLTCRR